MQWRVEDFQQEMDRAIRAYDKYVVCLNKTPDQCMRSIQSLMAKAIGAFESRGADLRHGIALDRHVTIMLSQTEQGRPRCGIYFNLSSPYQKEEE
ncbi:MAG: hypothetical protein ACPGL0_02500 [Limisphaerales bacterium]|jgi:hypothetical protein|nr:hypothetical protein [Verrucomicrobiota bacterium]